MDLQPDSTPWLRLTVINKGRAPDPGFSVEFKLLKENGIRDVLKGYFPYGLRRRVEVSKTEEKTFYEEVATLPEDAGIEYRFDLATFITSSDEFELSLLSRSRNWSKSAKIEAQEIAACASFGSIAYAEEPPLPTTKQRQGSQGKSPRSGILIGGYDPLAMSNELFLLLQRKRLIDSQQAGRLKREVSTYKKGILFGGINILKFDELIINSLVTNQALTMEQATQVISKSRNAGGVLVGGYNVIILKAEILNTLIKNNKISLEEGRTVVDRAKPAAGKRGSSF